jgi:hypothetical protein
MEESTPPPLMPAPASTDALVAQRAEDSALRDTLLSARWGYRAKQGAWRVTAFALWASILTSWLGIDRAFSWIVTVLGDTVRAAVAAANLTPTNTRYLSHVLRWGWFLVITNFRAAELLGLAVYCLAFPFSLCLYLFFRKFHRLYLRDRTSAAKQKGLVAPKRPTHYRALFATFLLAWFLLYGDTTNPRHLQIGAALASLLFLALAFRAFLGARPAAEDDAVIIPQLESFFYAVAAALMKGVNEKTPASKVEVWILHSIHEPGRNLCRRITLLIRGRRGRLRASAIIMADYMLSLVILGLSAILFWTLALKATIAPAAEDYAAAFRYTMAHFFAGVSIPQRNPTFPLWLDIGPSVTSWVLFVLFIGPAASLLPMRQQAYAVRVHGSYKRLRVLTLVISKYLRAAERRAKNLPST